MKKTQRIKGISILLSMALLTTGCSSKKQIQEQEDVSQIAVKAVTAEVGTIAISNQFIGTVAPQQQVSVIPMVSGVVDEIFAEVGDEVEAGEVLFHIEDDAARLQAENAQLAKQSAEQAAQAQLGTAQVMNNMSMASNIRSIQYQISLTKDQYDTAVNGKADAEEAKAQMNDSLEEINASVGSLQRSQKEMEKTIEEAKDSDYIVMTGLNKWEWETAYPYEKKPDEYDWGTDTTEPTESGTGSGQEPTETGSGQEPTETGSDATSAWPDLPTLPDVPEWPPLPDLPETAAKEEESSAAETESTESAAPTAGEETAAEPEETVAEPEETAAEPEGTADAPADGGEPADETALGAAPFAYFSQEQATEAKEPHPEEYSNIDEAWEAYHRQQKIDQMKDRVSDMGFSASDIKDGKADMALMENAAQIVALQYQASQIQSGLGTIDSSIASAESGAKTADKTIDFYEDNLKDAQATYEIQNGQAYQDTAAALATQLQTADVGVKNAQMQLGYYSPTTPISGTVVSKGVELYGMTQPGYAAYVISNQDAMNVTFAVSGKVKDSLQIGMPVTLEKSGSTFSGTITEIGETVDPQSGGLFVVKAITEAGGSQLAAGSSVKLSVDTQRAENAVLLPYDAVHFESEKAYVFVIKDGKAVNTPVTIGLMNDDMVEVTDGLPMKSRVVATWSAQLEDGAAVRVIGDDAEQEEAE